MFDRRFNLDLEAGLYEYSVNTIDLDGEEDTLVGSSGNDTFVTSYTRRYQWQSIFQIFEIDEEKPNDLQPGDTWLRTQATLRFRFP